MKVTAASTARALCAALVLTLAACSSEKGLSHYADQLSQSVENLLGSETGPSEHLDELAAVHEPDTWTLRRDVDDALPRARTALRNLATASYAGRDDATRVVEIVSQVATEHDFALMRVEAVDTLAAMAAWTALDVPASQGASSDDEMIDALKVLKSVAESAGTPPDTVGTAIRTVAAYDFEAVEPARPDAPLLRARRGYREHLRNARAVLKALTTAALDPYRADPVVRPALDEALGHLARAVVGLTLEEVVLGDETDTVRSSAALALANLRPRAGADVLGRVVRQDARSSVRRDAASALAAFSVQDAVPPLVDALADSVGDVRDAAIRSLRSLTGQDLGQDRAAWREWWKARSEEPGSPSEAADVSAR